jgi:D-alanyl-D-alanine carboxypeptidase
MPGNASVTLLGESSGGYVKVTYQGTTGWASSTYIQTGGSSGAPSGSGTATVIDGSLNLRASASMSSSVLLVMPDGATVRLNGDTANGYTSVTYNGTSGWAYSQYLQ